MDAGPLVGSKFRMRCIWAQSRPAMNASTPLPTAKTRQPSRVGLVHYENLADGLIHAAAVFGYPRDEDFIPKVAALAFLNGVQLVSEFPVDAGRIAGLVCQGLEVGRDKNAKFCRLVEQERGGPITASLAVESMVRKHFDGLNPENSSHVPVIRSLIAGSAAAGMYSRAEAHSLFQAACEEITGLRLEGKFLVGRLLWWADNDGLPHDHPVMELAARIYSGRRKEGHLMLTLIKERLLPLLSKDEPWALEHWLQPGWRDGRLAARFAPDLVSAVFDELPDEDRNILRALWEQSGLADVGASEEGALISQGFERYIREHYRDTLARDGVREANLRMLALRAYDYSVWMGFAAEATAAGRPVTG